MSARTRRSAAAFRNHLAGLHTQTPAASVTAPMGRDELAAHLSNRSRGGPHRNRYADQKAGRGKGGRGAERRRACSY